MVGVRRPLIEWALLSALGSRLCFSIVVSTDDERIASEARLVSVRGRVARIEIRPAELARDDTPTTDVLKWHVNQQDVKPDAVIISAHSRAKCSDRCRVS